jgi:cell division protein FtsB
MAKFVTIMALPLALHALYATGQKAVESFHLSESAQAIAAEIDDLKQQNLRLQRDIERARGEAEIERIAREQLGLIKPGDHPVVLLGPDSLPLAAPTLTVREARRPVASADAPNWRLWWRFFFGGPGD